MMQLTSVRNDRVFQKPPKPAHGNRDKDSTVYKAFYGPEMLGMMGSAFDRAWKELSVKTANKEGVRRKLARLIILRVDSGERGAIRLAALATADFVR